MIAPLLALTLPALSTEAPRGSYAAAPDPDLDRAFTGRRVALVVGVDDYDDEGLIDLRFAAGDARSVGALLEDPALGGFHAVEILTGDVSRDELTERLGALAAELMPEDTLLFYFAGHGTMRFEGAEPALYLMTTDGSLEAPETGLSLATLSAQFSSTRARQRVMILDACYSGQGRSGLSEETRVLLESRRGDGGLAAGALAASENEVRLFAATVDQPAWEDEALGHGVYTWYLMEALRGDGDLDGDGLVDVREAHEWTTLRTLEHTGRRQLPRLELESAGLGEIYLSGDLETQRPPTHGVVYGTWDPNLEVQFDGQAPRGAVEPGRRRVTVREGGETLVDGHVRVRPGEGVDVAGLIVQRSATRAAYAGPVYAGAFPPEAQTDELLPPGALRLGGWWMPQDPGGARPTLGGFGELYAGTIEGRDAYAPVVAFALQGGWLTGGDWSGGPTLSLGIAARGLGGLQIAPFAAPGLRAQTHLGGWYLSAEAEARLLLYAGADGATSVAPLPTFALTLGRQR